MKSWSVFTLLLFASPVLAMETKTYGPFKTKNWSTPVAVSFTTYRSGDLAVTAYFEPARNGGYQLQVWDVATGNQVCLAGSKTHNGHPTPITCSALGLPAGDYRAEFQAYSGGSVYVTLEITAETNP